MSYPARLKRDTLSSQSRREFFIPQPSLHIGLLRSDPWNEFLVHQPVSAEDLLNFQSIKAREDQELHEQVDKQLTVIAGRGPPSPPPVSVNDLLFGGPQLFQTAPEAVNPVVVGGDSINGAAEVAASEEPSLWNRMSSAWENLKTTTNTSLPDWFANEQSLVIPKDPEVRKVLGSIYGGTRTRVVVTVRVIEAVGVPALDWWGTSDPYVTVCLVRGVGGLSAGRLDLLPTMGGLKSTAPKFGTLDPKWNESVQLEPADLLSVISDSVLHISMWDKDVMVTDDPVGYTTVSLIDALQVGGVSPFPILPIQVTGSLIGPHAGVFVKIQLRMVNKVGCLSITPVALGVHSRVGGIQYSAGGQDNKIGSYCVSILRQRRPESTRVDPECKSQRHWSCGMALQHKSRDCLILCSEAQQTLPAHNAQVGWRCGSRSRPNRHSYRYVGTTAGDRRNEAVGAGRITRLGTAEQMLALLRRRMRPARLIIHA